ncbi:MAG: HpcH/HpaI aldolase/citrate lyase family protein [Acetobacter sp.]|nr:HpcH/HpaI aldolase/citrate lyase family protein [Bacteroides sp.]MCM1341572.1 HpcH/HpaI aldolase/citrate lyase family protein [Acetobacter sp.]MCM1433649.1 HpcH/HpaI aldolase/citrate lyase family protein [Clostridiales bacterium]
MLKLMYITNDIDIAKLAQSCGVDRIFVDMEYIGKAERQGGMDTVQNHHTVEDVAKIRCVLNKSELLVRVNPINSGSEKEINAVIDAGADIVMLPMWKSLQEVKEFINIVNGRVKTMLLLENQNAVAIIDDVLQICGIDEIHIGLNDLHLSQHKKFLFELLADGTVEKLAGKILEAGIPFGFGGFGRVGEGMLPAEYIVSEHYRLGSSISILSRAFCDSSKISNYSEMEYIFVKGIKDLREYETLLEKKDQSFFDETHKKLCRCVDEIVGRMN